MGLTMFMDDGIPVKRCRLCDQPMKPKGVKKLPDQYDHAQGCPYSRKHPPPLPEPLRSAIEKGTV